MPDTKSVTAPAHVCVIAFTLTNGTHYEPGDPVSDVKPKVLDELIERGADALIEWSE